MSFSCFKIAFLLILLTTGFSQSFAQPYDLEPSHWFPLDEGSYWHYQFEDALYSWDVVKTVDGDTLIGGERWVGISTVFCAHLPECSDVVSTEYFRFTDDDYLISSERDTIDVTYPMSIFRVEDAEDRLYSPMDRDSVTIRIQETTEGSVSDTTHLLMAFERVIPYFNSRYRYNIGDVLHLEGARVNGREVGRQDFIDSIINGDDPPVVEDTLNWTEYFPLQVGNFWDWETRKITEFKRDQREITGDTLINGTSYFKQRAFSYTIDGPQSTNRDSTWMEYLRYDSLNTRVVEWDADTGQEKDYSCNLSASFGSSSTCEGVGEAFVAGRYLDPPAVLTPSEDMVEFGSLKRFTNSEGGITYFYGIGGLPTSFDTRSVGITFIYLRIDGVEYGEMTFPVSIDDEPTNILPELSLYPNPTRGSVTISRTLPGEASITLYDIMGRKVREEAVCQFPCRLDTFDLSAGLYFIELQDPATNERSTKKITLIR
ncbi:MAG: T9SS type A sorting domain-containing protein [Rhodothermaceae bacterium]|nr:T9SS type A sorting domain-containing protein [Rhodothermaceae bacterium]